MSRGCSGALVGKTSRSASQPSLQPHRCLSWEGGGGCPRHTEGTAKGQCWGPERLSFLSPRPTHPGSHPSFPSMVEREHGSSSVFQKAFLVVAMQFVCRCCLCLAAEGFSQCAPDGARGSPRAREVSGNWVLGESWTVGPSSAGKAQGRSKGAT